VSFVVSQSGCGFGAIVPEFFLCKARQSRCHQGCRLPGDGAACPPVLFQLVPCSLQFHASIGRGFPADSIIRRGKSLVVGALPDLKCPFQISTAQATHFGTRSSVCSALI
jgi:hypothetical protein